MERDEDAGITKDSSQEIEGLLEKEKQVKSGRLLSLMLRETRWPTRLEARITIGLLPHPPSLPCIDLVPEHDQYDDMQGIYQVPVLSNLRCIRNVSV